MEGIKRKFATRGETEAALRERVKELVCLYGIARLSEQPEVPLPRVLEQVVEILPDAWQHTDVAFARIVVDDRVYRTAREARGNSRQRADIIVNGRVRGFVEVGYAPDEGQQRTFLREERLLIAEVGRRVSFIVERAEAEQAKERLQEQLRHADRLATIGQLAAGVAHELNEPLGSILGFAQLARKCDGMPPQADKDIGRIEGAALHAREIIRKLMVFARQTPPRKSRVDLNRVVEQALDLCSSRCEKSGVQVSLDLAESLPPIVADPGQLGQVLVNLVVNALQAMPSGGRLTVSTARRGEEVQLVVQDSGAGMTEEVRRQIFMPFFTTKDVDEGTGLGLSVVHGIISGHGGNIRVESSEGHGSEFRIMLPVGRRGASGKDSDGDTEERVCTPGT